ncbi:D-2-hydroxyacid dehydrogenase [Kordiimonas sediminis]|uniref:D-2-hydroxyacid dehydrogenase n=1 Tax=Kordiimonas sediminis TaxID=1735581 RepID=A0A919E9A1_9PROT|nr:FAD-binding oxidoreductase [Kordiimonas sediminis]GHF26601.1 D-2-hydroxyacid dehydrogenase [Kordiimonas sediminis]
MIEKSHIDHLVSLLGPECATTDQDRIAPLLREWRDKYFGHTQLLLTPNSAEQLSDALRYCNAHGVAVVPQGGNTGLVGAGLPGLANRDEVLISTQRMNKVLDVCPNDYSITVEAGVTIKEIQQSAETADRLFPLSLASEGSCTAGGTIATNAGGVHVIRYGSMQALTMGVEAVLADGTIYSDLSPLRKDNTGYKLSSLFAGSEGTLGIITKATLKLYPPERHRITTWIAIDDINSALNILEKLRDVTADRVSVFEIMPHSGLELVLRHIPSTLPPFPGKEFPWYILAEIGSSIHDPVLEETVEDCLSNMISNNQIADGIIAQSEQQRLELWKLRESLSEAQKHEGGSIKHDISVPVSQVPEFVKTVAPEIEQRWTGSRVIPFGHLGDGNLHFNVMQPSTMDKQAFLANWEEMNRFVHDRVTDFSGSISAEHGIGSMKAQELKRLKPASSLHAMQMIKKALDPNNILNPGALFTRD